MTIRVVQRTGKQDVGRRITEYTPDVSTVPNRVADLSGGVGTRKGAAAGEQPVINSKRTGRGKGFRR